MSAPASKMSHTQLLDSIIQKQKTKKNSLPFLHELLSLNDKEARKQKAFYMLKDYAKVGRNGFDVVKHRVFNQYNCTIRNRIHCIFGEFVNWGTKSKDSLENTEYIEKGISYGKCFIKNGIEILTAQPNAKNSTYSEKCRITVKELKEACKANGIKATGDKKALLKALMKV